jgi:hypothetical protein
MLGDVALRRPHLIDYFLHTGFLVAEDAQDFETQWVSDRLERTGGQFDMFLLLDQIE